jgi:hypothetical protein
MVDTFPFKERSSEKLGHDVTVFQNWLSANGYDSVSLFVDVTGALGLTFCRPRITFTLPQIIVSLAKSLCIMQFIAPR